MSAIIMKSIPRQKSKYLKFQKALLSFPKHEQKRLKSAYFIAKKEHIGQRKFGIYPYIAHPLSVCNFIVQKLKIRDIDILTAALLHDTVEDGKLSFSDIQKRFGNKVTAVIKAVTRIPKTKESERQKAIFKIKHFNKFITQGSYEVQIVGIADKFDNIKNMDLIQPGNHNYQKRIRWIREAKKFIPIAKKINKNSYLILRREIERAEKFLKI